MILSLKETSLLSIRRRSIRPSAKASSPRLLFRASLPPVPRSSVASNHDSRFFFLLPSSPLLSNMATSTIPRRRSSLLQEFKPDFSHHHVSTEASSSSSAVHEESASSSSDELGSSVSLSSSPLPCSPPHPLTFSLTADAPPLLHPRQSFKPTRSRPDSHRTRCASRTSPGLRLQDCDHEHRRRH